MGVDILMAFSRRLCSVLKSLSRHKVELVMSLRHLEAVRTAAGHGRKSILTGQIRHKYSNEHGETYISKRKVTIAPAFAFT